MNFQKSSSPSDFSNITGQPGRCRNVVIPIFALTKSPVETPVMPPPSKQSNKLNPRRLGKSTKTESGKGYELGHQSYIAHRVLRSYSCSSSIMAHRTTSSSLSVSQIKRRRQPLASLPIHRKVRPPRSSARATAVLPKRTRVVDFNKHPKRFCHSGVRHHERIEVLVRGKIAGARERGKLATETLRLQGVADVYNNKNNGSIDSKESETDHDENGEINSATILRQLNILKCGGYWEHLPKEDTREGEQEHHSDEDILLEERQRNHPRLRMEINEENIPPANHPNVQLTYGSQMVWDEEDDDSFEYNEEEEDRNSIDPFVGSALKTNCVTGESIGFRIHSITQDGWMCCPEIFDSGNRNKSKETLIATVDTEEESEHVVLLNLPSKLASLGRQGMLIRGIDLMKRRDNGALEPHTHDPNTGHSIRYTFRRDVSSITDHLIGRISL